MSHKITFNDLIECQRIEEPLKQQLFLLSRFFNESETNLERMSLIEISPLIIEMNEYFKKMDPDYSFEVKELRTPPDEPINDRSEILDL